PETSGDANAETSRDADADVTTGAASGVEWRGVAVG
ncbi:hypothetical protein V491_00675, partial [Pseudogymnoascus sp. VKM F-3775]